MLTVDQVEKYYGNSSNVTKALDKISFSVAKGEFIAIMGASGSGKTTLLNCIATIDTVSAGHIYLEEQDLTEILPQELARFRREKLGFVFQDFNLLDTLTIAENISLALTINQAASEEIASLVEKTAEQLGIADILGKFPYQVSGGQKQRAACARAIICQQSLLLADEPTGALDSKSSKNLLMIMKQLNQQQVTILMVTHDPYSASYASRVLFLKDGRLFNELLRGQREQALFYQEILAVLGSLGGGFNDVV